MKEIWKNIPGYKSLYKASNLGRIKNAKDYVLSSGDNGNGYKSLCLWKNRKDKRHYVHRLIALTFIPNPDNKSTVNHKNGIKNDNKLNNLEWMTYSENHIHAFKNGWRSTYPTSGSRNRNAKLTEAQVSHIRYLIRKGKTNRYLADHYGIDISGIYNIKMCKTWKHVK